MKIEMRKFESLIENLNEEEFKNTLLEFQGKEIDEMNGRVENFDFKNIGNYRDDSVENYLRKLSSIKSIDDSEFMRLLEEVEKGEDHHREQLMEGMLKSVAKIALKYSKVGSSYAELVQDGLMGVVDAIKNYTPTTSMSFIEYAEYWIKYRMVKSNKAGILELKESIITYLQYLKVELYQKTLNENQKTSILDEKDLEKTLGITLEEFEKLERMNNYGILIKEEDKEKLRGYTTIIDIDFELKKLEKIMTVSNLANKFTNEDIKILDLYYGLSEKRKYFEDIAKVLGLKSEEVKARIDKLMIKLKYNGKRVWIDEN